MSDPNFYYANVVREKIVDPPAIFEDEKLLGEFKRGIQPMMWIILIVSIFILPLLPFVVALLLFEKFWHLKHSQVYVTDKRLVCSNRLLKYYNVSSLPLSKIKTLRRASLDNPFVGMLDRIFGFSDIQIWTNESILRNLVIDSVKKSKDLVQLIETQEGRKIGKI